MNRLPRIRDFDAYTEGWGYFLCTSKELRPIRNGELLLFTLQDSSAQIQAKLLDDVDRFKEEFDAGEFVRVEGKTTIFQGQLQLAVTRIRRVNPPQDRLQGFREEDCVLSAPRSLDEMWKELTEHVASVDDPHIRVLLNRVLADHEAQLREWPAAQQIHHAYRGGLLEHIVKMADIGRYLARAYDANEDLVLAGVILHDIGKLQELEYETATQYSLEGNLLGHITLGVMLVRDAAKEISGFPAELLMELEHLILSHHGSREFGSPVEPMTIEAFILATCDDLDAKLHQINRHIAEDDSDGPFTPYHPRLKRVFFKSGGGRP